MYTRYYLGVDLRTSYMLLIVPRICMCAISFINDYSLYRICFSYGLHKEIRLIAMASSYVILVFGTRTFTNTFEMALSSILLFYVAECMIHSNKVIDHSEFIIQKHKEAKNDVDRVRFFKMGSALPSHSFNKCMVISSLCVAGVFNRPTFLAFGFPIVFYWLIRGLGSKIISIADFNLRIAWFFLCAIPSLITFILIDSLYYGYLTVAEIDFREFGINNFVVTPLNFIKYNIDATKTAEHGIHPRYMHFLVNIPLLFNILGVVTISSFGFMAYRFCRNEYQFLPRAQSIVGLMYASIFVPVGFLSIFNHQEPRFLLPILLPVILLHAPKLEEGFCTRNPFRKDTFLNNFIYKNILSSKSSAKYILKIWYTINIVLVLFYGFLHQGGVYQLSEHFSGLMLTRGNNVQVHLVTSHIYNMPQSFLLQPNSNTLHINRDNGQKFRKNKQFHLYEYGSLEMDLLYKKLNLILNVAENKKQNKNQRYQLYLAIPSSLSDDLNLAFIQSNSTSIRHTQIKVFYPHVSTEALPKLFIQHSCEINTDINEIYETCSIYNENDGNRYSVSAVIREFFSVVHQFGLSLYRIDFIKIDGK